MDELNNICCTCLSSDRTLVKIKDLKHLEDEFRTLHLNLNMDSICWECRAVVSKMSKFKIQATKAQQLLKRSYQLIRHDMLNMTNTYNMSNTLQSLTQLVRETKSYYNLEIEEKGSNIEDTVCAPNFAEPLPSSSNYSYSQESAKKSDRIQFKIEIDRIQSDSDNEHVDEDNENLLPNIKKEYAFVTVEEEIEEDAAETNDIERNFLLKRLTEDEMLTARKKAKSLTMFRKNPYKCKSCIIGFKEKADYEKHILSNHSAEAGFECTVCQSNFKTEFDLNKHIIEHYTAYVCKECHYIQKNLEVMKVHYLRKHILTRGSKIICRKCPDRPSFTSHSSLRYHRDSKHSEEFPQCDECGKLFKAKRILADHMAVHRVMECDVCHMMIKGKWELRAHKELAHSNKPEINTYCAECDIHFKSIAGFKSHLKLSLSHNGLPLAKKDMQSLPHENENSESQMESEQTYSESKEGTRMKREATSDPESSGSEDNPNFGNEKPNIDGAGHTKLVMSLESKFNIIKMTEEEVFNVRKDMRENPKYAKGKFKCDTCIVGFDRKFLFDIHISEKHLEKCGTPCVICSARFPPEEMDAHLYEHFKCYQCKVCALKNVDLKIMEKHYSKQHGKYNIALQTQYKCKHCPDLPVFKSRSLYKYHMLSKHSTEYPTCELCGKKYTCKFSLKKHMMTHTGAPLVECDICHKMIKITTGLATHKRVVHTTTVDESAFCIECNKRFKNIYTYRAHALLHSSHVKPATKKFECTICNKKFGLPSILNQHHKKVHLRLMEKSCHICDKKFLTGCSLNKHLSTVHEGQKEVKDHMCVVCGKMFSKFMLKQHMNTHTGQRPYTCRTCPDTFAQKSSLYMHNRLVHLKLKKKRRAGQGSQNTLSPQEKH